MFETSSDGAQARGEPLSFGVDFVKCRTPARKCTGNLVYKYSSGKSSEEAKLESYSIENDICTFVPLCFPENVQH